MALYLRSFSARIPALTCLTNGPAYLTAKEYNNFGALQPQSHNYVPGLHLPDVELDVNERRGIKIKTIKPLYLPRLPASSGCHCQSLRNAKSNANLYVNPQPKLNPEEKSASAYPTDNNSKDPDGKPTPEQLNRVYLRLQEELPEFFTRGIDRSLYSDDIELVDNIRGKVFRGLSAYVMQLTLLRIVGHLRYTFVKAEIVNMYQDLKDGRVIVQWRIKGVMGVRIRLWDWKRALGQEETWHDGLSYYDVSGTDGKIYRHTVDRLMEDRIHGDEEQSKKLRLLEKLKLAGASGAFVSPLIIGTLDSITPA